MTATIEAFAVVVIGLLPGAALLWTLETVLGSWWARTPDRLYRFVALSLLVHLLLAPLTYGLWVLTPMVRQEAASWPLLVIWPALLLYVVIPVILGRALGRAWQRNRRWSRGILGEPAPSAWDHLWQQLEAAWVRVKLHDGSWIAGVYSSSNDGPSAYASAFPNEPDLYLSETVEVDQEDGSWIRSEDGAPRVRNAGILLRWSDIALVEVVPR